MCAAKTPFEKLLQFGSESASGDLDHGLLSKVVALHDRIAFFNALGGHHDVEEWTNDLFNQTCNLAPIFKKPVSARIALADGLSVPRARSILPIHPLASAPLPRAPLWMHDLPFGPETGVRAQRLDLSQARETPLPAKSLLDANGPVAAETLLSLASRDFAGMGYAMMLGRDDDGSQECWRFKMHSAQLRLYGPIDLTGADIAARTCAYAGRSLQQVVETTQEQERPTPFVMSGTMCGEHVLGSALSIPLAQPTGTGISVVVLIHDLHSPDI
ncbi:MAG: hypothetical protein NXI16_05615 [Alphaproteobacteria bacterium]|nr:hypothetical protein [Alphaproteobacteria bacterium]